MVDIVPNTQEIIGHGSFSLVYRARLKIVSLFFYFSLKNMYYITNKFWGKSLVESKFGRLFCFVYFGLNMDGFLLLIVTDEFLS